MIAVRCGQGDTVHPTLRRIALVLAGLLGAAGLLVVGVTLGAIIVAAMTGVF
jgi:hypothetical protein